MAQYSNYATRAITKTDINERHAPADGDVRITWSLVNVSTCDLNTGDNFHYKEPMLRLLILFYQFEILSLFGAYNKIKSEN